MLRLGGILEPDNRRVNASYAHWIGLPEFLNSYLLRGLSLGDDCTSDANLTSTLIL